MAPMPSRNYEITIERDGKRHEVMIDTTAESRARVLAQQMFPGCTVTHCRHYDELLHDGKRLVRVGEFWWLQDKIVRVLRVSGLRSLLLVVGRHEEHVIRNSITGETLRMFRTPETLEGSPYCEDFRKPTETEKLAALEAVEKGTTMKQTKQQNTTTKEPQDCGCGCGGKTGGGKFLPGHDAKLKGRLIREAREGNKKAIASLKDLGWAKYIPAVEPKAKKTKKGEPAAEQAAPVVTPEPTLSEGA